MIIDSYNMSYEWYLFESVIEEAKLLAHTQECALIAEGKNDYQHMRVVHEGVSDTLKSAYKKIVDLFAKIWAKFVQTTKSLFSSNVTYLNNYKEIILKKPAPESRKWTMYNWQDGQKALLSTAIPNFNYNSMKDKMGDELTFCKAYFMHLMPADAKEANIEQYALKKFRGGLDEEQEILESRLNMTDMFNYCMKYESIINNLQKDVNNVKKASSECENNINKAEAEGKLKHEPEYGQQNSQPNAPQNGDKNNLSQEDNQSQGNELPKAHFNMEEKTKDKNNKFIPMYKKMPSGEIEKYDANSGTYKPTGKALAESYDYLFEPDKYKSFVYEGFVLEFGQGTENKGATTNGDPNDPSKSMQKFDKSRNTGDIDTDKVSSYEDAVKRINVYNKCCTAVASAKMATAETIYKQYMTIIKAKVRFYVGDKETKDVGAASSTNQNVQANQQAANTGVNVNGTANQL